MPGSAAALAEYVGLPAPIDGAPLADPRPRADGVAAPRTARLRVLRIANFVSPTSGGIRTVMRRLSLAQAELGVHSTIVVPGPVAGIDPVPDVIDVGTLRGVPIAPGQPYRMVLSRRAVRELLDRARPDVVEIHDQISLAWLGAECRRRGIRTVLIAHERLDLLAQFWSGRDFMTAAARRWVARLGASVDRVVVPSAFAAEPFRAAGIDARIVHWGVDGSTFTPGSGRGDSGVLVSGAKRPALRLVHAGRLSAEKDPLLSARAAEHLAAAGVDVELLVVGSGPEEPRFASFEHARLVGYVDGAGRMAQILQSADVFLAPGPFETFGVSALEAMACGVPVVCRESGSISEIPGTTQAPGTGAGFGAAALALASRADLRRDASRIAAGYTWAKAAGAMRAHYEG